MKKISFWAKAHHWQARILIVVCYLLLTIIGTIIGLQLNDLSIQIPSWFMGSTIILFLAAGIIYPISNKRTYLFRKTCDSILAVCTFLMIIFAGNQYGGLSGWLVAANSPNEVQASVIKDSSKTGYKSIQAFTSSMKDKDGKMLKWKERRKLLKTQLREIKKSDELSDGAKAGLTILCVVVALGLLYLVAAAACSLSCNGAEAAALLVGIGGLAAVVVLFVIAIRAIYNKKKKKVIPPENKAVEEAQKADGN